jgi:hypothetical protein
MNGCITKFITQDGKEIEDLVSIKSIIPKMPYKTVEQLAVASMLINNEDDTIEGLYTCPLCGRQFKAERREEDGIVIDTSDKMSKLEINYFDTEKDSFEIHVDLTEPVTCKNKEDKDELILEVNSFDISIPTLEDCIIAENNTGLNSNIKLQIAIYVQALKKINTESIDNKFKNMWGLYVFGHIRNIKKDLGQVSDYINRFGLDKRAKEKHCACGKVWRPTVNTSNFFVGAPLTI